MFVSEWGEPFHVVGYVQPLLAEFVEGSVQIPSVPERYRVDDEPEGTELVFLALAVALAELTAVAVEDVSDEGMSVGTFTAVRGGSKPATSSAHSSPRR